MSERKRIPSGQTNFERIRTGGYLYVDKTRFIEQLENEDNQYHFFVRPRKFGKTLFTSVLEHYYDVRFADKFEKLFGDLYIGKKKTEKANKIFVVKFNFSGLDTSSIERFDIAIKEKVENQLEMFLRLHDSVIENVEDEILELRKRNTAGSYLEFIFA